MTVLNLAIGQDRAFICSDTLIVGGGELLHGSKTIAFPHLGLVLAGSGHLVIFERVAAMLLAGLPPATSVDDLAETLPDALGECWLKLGCTNPTMIVLIGVPPSSSIAAFVLQAPAFDARRLAPGIYLSPPLRPAEATPAVPWDRLEPTDTTETRAVEIAARPWRELVAAAVDSVDRQRGDGNVQIGGQLIATFLDEFQIHQTVLRELPL